MIYVIDWLFLFVFRQSIHWWMRIKENFVLLSSVILYNWCICIFLQSIIFSLAWFYKGKWDKRGIKRENKQLEQCAVISALINLWLILFYFFFLFSARIFSSFWLLLPSNGRCNYVIKKVYAYYISSAIIHSTLIFRRPDLYEKWPPRQQTKIGNKEIFKKIIK